jgi:hypothetical protein
MVIIAMIAMLDKFYKNVSPATPANRYPLAYHHVFSIDGK